jgi:hypothetical protein
MGNVGCRIKKIAGTPDGRDIRSVRRMTKYQAESGARRYIQGLTKPSTMRTDGDRGEIVMYLNTPTAALYFAPRASGGWRRDRDNHQGG